MLESFQAKLGKSVATSEVSSWKHSLQRMDKVLEDPEIPDNAGVAIEFNIPNTGKRIDFILTGTGPDGKRTAVIVELKQWERSCVKTGPPILCSDTELRPKPTRDHEKPPELR